MSSFGKQLQVNITRGKDGRLNYTVNKLPNNEPLVATMTYEQASKGPAWIPQTICTTGASVLERNPEEDSGAISFKRIEQCIIAHEAAEEE